ncbi:MAG: alpha-2-macroglobulin family protein, partial [Ferruginibacter sp.]|nr:alpha-2-macroglobulin family protein [Cytophagales bacterium]
MRSKALSSLLILLGAVAFFSCSRNGQLKVEKTNFGEEVALQQNLLFTFNGNVVPDSLLNQWDTTAYVVFEPAVKGKFRWNAPDELVFSPDLGFRASTAYQARLTDETGRVRGAEKRAVDTEKTYAFHTPYLKLGSTDIVWTKNNRGVIEALFNLNFNYRVNPAEVGNLLDVKVDGKGTTFNVTTSALADVVQVAAAQPAGTNWDAKAASLTIRKGLRCAESAYVSTEPMGLQTELPDKSN